MGGGNLNGDNYAGRSSWLIPLTNITNILCVSSQPQGFPRDVAFAFPPNSPITGEPTVDMIDSIARLGISMAN